jgi:hypothetical protein
MLMFTAVMCLGLVSLVGLSAVIYSKTMDEMLAQLPRH